MVLPARAEVGQHPAWLGSPRFPPKWGDTSSTARLPKTDSSCSGCTPAHPGGDPAANFPLFSLEQPAVHVSATFPK